MSADIPPAFPARPYPLPEPDSRIAPIVFCQSFRAYDRVLRWSLTSELNQELQLSFRRFAIVKLRKAKRWREPAGRDRTPCTGRCSKCSSDCISPGIALGPCQSNQRVFDSNLIQFVNKTSYSWTSRMSKTIFFILETFHCMQLICSFVDSSIYSCSK